MIRKLLSASALVLAAACSSGGPSPIVTVVKSVVLPSKDEAETKAAPAPITRERIVKNGLAMIRARLETDEKASILTAFSVNNGYVTFANSTRQSINLRGGLITATRGIGQDLLSVIHSANDPVATQTLPDLWPESYRRGYRFAGKGPEGDVLTFACNVRRLPATTIEIVEISYDTVEFRESCVAPDRSFTNTYFAEVETGQIWKSRQWVGAELGYISLEIFEPYTP